VNKIPQRQQQIIGIAVLMAICILINVRNLATYSQFLIKPRESNTLEDYHAEAYPPRRFQILLYLDDNFRNWTLIAPSEEFLENDLKIIPQMFVEAGGQMRVDYHDYHAPLTDDEAAGLLAYEHVWFDNGDDIDIYVFFSDGPETSKTNWLATYNHSFYIIPQSLVPMRMRE